MSYKEQDIVYEKGPYWVLDVGREGYEIYRVGITHSTRCAIIGYQGEFGIEKAKAEIERRLSAA